jgi:DNA-directed RNA polymerase specialized sigma24 family protein
VRVLEELAKEGTRARLLRIALLRRASAADAEDLVADAIELVCDPDGSPWDPSTVTFLRHFDRVMRHLADAQRRVGFRRFEVADSRLVDDGHAVDGAPPPDEALAERRDVARLRRLGARLVDAMAASDPDALRVLEIRAAGAEKPAEVADAMGAEPDAIYDAYRRIRYHAQRILEQDRASPAASVEATQKPSTRQKVPT